MTQTNENLVVVVAQANALITAEVRAGVQRKQLERAVREAVTKLGADINELSAASGLTVRDIERILATTPALELDEIVGVA